MLGDVKREMDKIILRCPNCNGSGMVHDEFYSSFFDCLLSERLCPICKGKGTTK